jgi:hypothetical protein
MDEYVGTVAENANADAMGDGPGPTKGLSLFSEA